MIYNKNKMFKEKLLIFNSKSPEKRESQNFSEKNIEKPAETLKQKKERLELADELAGELTEDISLETVKEGSKKHLEIKKEMEEKSTETNKKRAEKAKKIEEEMKKLIVKGFESADRTEKTKIKKTLKEKLVELNGINEVLGLPKTTLKEWNDRARANKKIWIEKYGTKKTGISESQRKAANKLLF